MNEFLKKFDNIETINEDDIEKMNFYETAIYLQTLNQVEELYDEMLGDNNG